MDIDGNIYCPRCMRRLTETDPDLAACPLCGREPGTRRPPMALDAGTLLAGRYQLGDVIGQGGFGVTYAAWDETLGMPVAVKEYFPREDASRDPEVSDDLVPFPEQEARYADGLARFRRESNLLASLQGIPCVVKVLDYFSENQTAYIVMEYVHGIPVDRWARENGIKAAELPEKLRPVFDALVRTHSQGVIHRDITPDNLLVREDGSLTLIDFGSAVEVSRNGGTVLLTRRYAPIEQYGREYGRQGPWTDVYGLAAVLYTLATGEEPVEAPLRAQRDEQTPLARRHTGLKRREAAAIDKALTVDPEKRTQSMAEFRAALYHLPMPEEVIRRRRFMRRVIAVASVLLILLGLVTLNFTTGLPVGSGLLGSLRSNGIQIVRRLREQQEVSAPESVLGIPVSRIGPDAFRGDGALRSVRIPGSVRDVGDSAFYGCPNLEEATLAEGVGSVGTSAFGACENLQTLSLPDSLETIGDNAIPAEAALLTVWGSRGTEAEHCAEANGLRFADASELAWEIRDGAAEITAVQTDAKRLTLPNTVEGVPVTSIAEGIRLTQQEEVWLPEYLETVTPKLFMRDVYDPAPSRLTGVRLGSHVRVIGAEAFAHCQRLKALTLPDTLEQIGESAFFDAGLTEITLPDGLREIGKDAFRATDITRVDIPDSVGSIGEGAFSYMENLAEISLPDTLQSIPSYTFANSSLPRLTIPESVMEIGSYSFECSGIEWITLPEGLKVISKDAFQSCQELRFVLVPASVEEIDGTAFSYCPADLIIAGDAGTAAEAFAHREGILFEDMGQWTLPDYWTDDGGTAYYEVNRTEQIIRVPLYNEKNRCLVTGCHCAANPSVNELILSPFQTEIAFYSFMNSCALRRVSTAGIIRQIGASAFSGCASLESIPLENVDRIEAEAFSGCAGLTALNLENVTYIGSDAFRNCASLRELRLSGRLAAIDISTFESCTGLQYAILPGSLRNISFNAFANCSGLQLVVFREGATASWADAFLNCTSLEAVYYPSTVGSVDPVKLEKNCPHLRDIWIFNPNVTLGETVPGQQPGWTLHGYAGSTAEAWANKNGVPFEPIPEGTAMPDPQEIIEAFDFQ